MINIRIDTKSVLDKSAYVQLQRLKGKFNNLDEILFQASKELRNRMRKRIIDQLNADGKPLTPLLPATIRRKEKRGSQTASQVLIETGNFLKTINVVATKRTLRIEDTATGGRHPSGIFQLTEKRAVINGRAINRNIIFDTLTRSRLNKADNDYLKNYIYRFLRKN